MLQDKDDEEYGFGECDIFAALWKIAKKEWNRKGGKQSGEDFEEEIASCCYWKHDFDVYQVLAFESTDPRRNIVVLWKYRLKCLKGFLCALTQVFGMAVVLYQLTLEGVAQ